MGLGIRKGKEEISYKNGTIFCTRGGSRKSFWWHTWVSYLLTHGCSMGPILYSHSWGILPWIVMNRSKRKRSWKPWECLGSCLNFAVCSLLFLQLEYKLFEKGTFHVWGVVGRILRWHPDLCSFFCIGDLDLLLVNRGWQSWRHGEEWLLCRLWASKELYCKLPHSRKVQAASGWWYQSLTNSQQAQIEFSPSVTGVNSLDSWRDLWNRSFPSPTSRWKHTLANTLITAG